MKLLRLSAIVAAFFTLSISVGYVAAQTYQYLQVANGSAGTPSISGTTRTNGLYFGTNYTAVARHLAAGASTANLPVISGCGTTPVLATGSSDVAGRVTQGGSTTGCVITFGTAYATAPVCQVHNETLSSRAFTIAVTTTAITVASLTASDVITWICVGVAGG